MFDSLGAYGKDDPPLLRNKLKVRYSIARHYAQIKDPRWHENLDAAIAISEHCAALPRSTPSDKFFLFGLYAEKALQLSLESGQSPEVGALLERAVNGIEALYRQLPDDRIVAAGVMQIYQRVSFTYGGTARTPETLPKAIAIERKAIALATSLQETRKPNDPDYQSFFRNSLISLGSSLVDAGQFDEGVATLKKALELSLAALRAEPNNQELAGRVLNCIHNLAFAVFSAKKYEQTVVYSRQAFEQYMAVNMESRKIVYIRTYMADINEWLGISLLELDRPAADLAVRRATLGEACKALSESVAYIEEMRVEKLGAVSKGEFKQRIDGLARCKARLAKLTTR